MKITNWSKRFADVCHGLVELLYPRPCAGCIRNAPLPGHLFCMPCLSALSFTNSHLYPEEQIEQHFWGRVPFKWGMSMLYLVPGGVTQHLLYHIKYRGKKQFAEKIGEWYGIKVRSGKRYDPVDLIVPVPLHWKKQQKRGYNQSAYFARGLSATLEVPVETRCLIRERFTHTQTRKARMDRLDNMKNAFRVVRPEALSGKQILLVDDVLTTGATLEACALKILESGCRGVCFMTIATGRI